MLEPPGKEAPMTAVHYESYTEARTHFKDLLDAAGQGRVATVRRDTEHAAVVDASRLRHVLWSAFFPGLPISADGATFEEAIDELIDALREYAEDWHERLLNAPNHRDNWGLVQLISLSDNAQLRQWLLGAAK
jgi:ABC-type phosphate/phosphonate transport system substrate-binding protein